MSELDKSASILKSSGVIIFPTDTVWGIGALSSDHEAIKKLYHIKKRPMNQPTAILVSGLDQAKKYAKFNSVADQLTHDYWPGELTVILPSIVNLPEEVVGEGRGVGLRAPDHEFTQQLCDRVGEGVVTSSANFAGENSPQSRGEINSELISKVDYMVGEGECGKKDPSSIIDLTHSTPYIVRHGSINLNKWIHNSR